MDNKTSGMLRRAWTRRLILLAGITAAAWLAGQITVPAAMKALFL